MIQTPESVPELSNAQPRRKKVEALFPELRNQIGLRRCACDYEVHSGAVLSGSLGAEHQATDALTQPTNRTAAPR
jgi:hypothetical protein